MKTPRYICSKCRQPFTRRWNAYRHSNNKHFGSIEDIISFTEFTINGVDSSVPLNDFYEDKNSNHHPINVKNQLLILYPNLLDRSYLAMLYLQQSILIILKSLCIIN